MHHNMSTDTPNLLHSLIPTALHPWLILSYPVSFASTFRPSVASHRSPSPTLYTTGPKDLFFVTFCALAFTVTREIVVRWVLYAFARWWIAGGDKKGERISRRDLRAREHTATRFAEQGWSFLYCTSFWTMGMVSGWGSLAWDAL